jgi:hypothetical protein
MTILKSIRVRLLLAANALAVAFLFADAGLAQGDEWETFCPPEATGCDCLKAMPFSPGGCYDNLGDVIVCSSNEWCAINPE